LSETKILSDVKNKQICLSVAELQWTCQTLLSIVHTYLQCWGGWCERKTQLNRIQFANCILLYCHRGKLAVADIECMFCVKLWGRSVCRGLL